MVVCEVWTQRGPGGTLIQQMSGFRTHDDGRHALDGHLSTNGGAYPQQKGSYPHHRVGPLRPRNQRFSGLVGIQHLAERPNVAPEVVVLRHLALDLLAAMQDGRVVTATERLADPQ